MKKLVLASLIVAALTACGGSSDDKSAIPEPITCSEQWIDTKSPDQYGLVERLYSVCSDGSQEHVETKEFAPLVTSPMDVSLANHRTTVETGSVFPEDVNITYAQETEMLGDVGDGYIEYEATRAFVNQLQTAKDSNGTHRYYWSLAVSNFTGQAGGSEHAVTLTVSTGQAGKSSTRVRLTSNGDEIIDCVSLNDTCSYSGSEYHYDSTKLETLLFVNGINMLNDHDKDWATIALQFISEDTGIKL
ncbi:hypothetical protein EKG38_14000 [Shewanella canadensis]|uniref:Lipoprotein n=1 Tax=Shewanella canadensis TaxID=271096 RepID=A0A431WSK2_9GAMM|nr:hypothetical protein [Shewanella canadensis]RTR38612.1 hypothetical protein EKG38_14000 [Shewanella canadensis]